MIMFCYDFKKTNFDIQKRISDYLSVLSAISVSGKKYRSLKVKRPVLIDQGRIQDFKLGGAHLKKLRRAEGGAKICGVFRVKIHDFTPKKQNTESPSYL